MLNTLSTNTNNTNAKALGLTVLTCGLLILLFILIRWQNAIPIDITKVDDGGIEVNFGNSDQGMGDVPPMVQGYPAPEAQESTPTPANAAPAHEEQEQLQKEVAENNDADAPVIKTSPKPKVVERPIEKQVEKKHIVKTNTPTPVSTSKNSSKSQETVTAVRTPKPQSPKAVYKGGNGKGGNGADSYNGVSSQGIAGGRGDQGKMGGDPNSDSYNGTGKGTGGSGSGKGSSGVQVISGLSGRRFAGFPSFEDSFNENARVSVDIAVNASGHVTSASINPRGTTTTNSNIRSIAIRRARQLKFNAGSAESQTGTVSFNFRLKG